MCRHATNYNQAGEGYPVSEICRNRFQSLGLHVFGMLLSLLILQREMARGREGYRWIGWHCDYPFPFPTPPLIAVLLAETMNE